MNANTELAKTALLMVMFKSIGKVNEVEQLRVVIDSTIQKQDLEAQLKLCADREVSESTLSTLRDNIKHHDKSIAIAHAHFSAFTGLSIGNLQTVDDYEEWASRSIQKQVK
tara:strand:+ start:55 stop:387 length:333 start_codon:yes stop_codon:yes gene_type:complete